MQRRYLMSYNDTGILREGNYIKVITVPVDGKIYPVCPKNLLKWDLTDGSRNTGQISKMLVGDTLYDPDNSFDVDTTDPVEVFLIIDQVAMSSIAHLSGLFANNTTNTEYDFSHLDASHIRSLSNLFTASTCKGLNFNNGRTFYKVESLFGAFSTDWSPYGNSLMIDTELDLSSCNFSGVMDCSYMFFNQNKLTKITFGYDMKKVTSTTGMFLNTSTTGDLYVPNKNDFTKIIAALPSGWTVHEI